MFTLTSAAARQIQQAARLLGSDTNFAAAQSAAPGGGAAGSANLGSDPKNQALRIAARVDAEGAVEYGMGFDDPKDEDMKLELEGVAVVIAEEYQDLLNDTVLDYVELEPGEFNFIFSDAALLGSDTKSPGGCGGCSSGGCGSKERTH